MSITSQDWYEERVESGVRDVVKMLRDNGINTCSSCHHDMTIQAQYVCDGAIQDIHNLLSWYLLSRGEPVNYTLSMHEYVQDGHTVSSFIEIHLLGREKVERKKQKRTK